MLSAFNAMRIEFRGAEAPRGRRIPPHTLHEDIDVRNWLASNLSLVSNTRCLTVCFHGTQYDSHGTAAMTENQTTVTWS